MPNNKLEIDIVIPVYNALEDLKKCVDSIKMHTNLEKHRVILINDCSPDQNILPYLKSIADGNIILLNNEKNMGFSATINKGLKYSDRDVILLNTDTIVTKNWVEKMIACAYSDKSIGTVTPFSNNATLCSIPNFCEENVLPEGYTIDSYAALIERCSLRKYPRITVAVGFCMYIKRCVVNDIGYFDAETFGRGYGEENDFCNRAEQVGYKHVLCDDTYIYHSGTASFLSDEKKKLIQEHENILYKRYPKQMETNHLYCMRNPEKYLRDNVEIYTKLGMKRNILYVLHMDFETTMGGTQYHVKDLVDELRIDNNIFVVSPYKHYLKLTIYLEKEEINLKYYINNNNKNFLAFYDAEQKKIFENIYAAFQIDIVHVHHLMEYSFDCIYSAHQMNIPVIFTAHDYYMICPTIKLVNEKNQYCNLEKDISVCSSCMSKKLGYAETVSGEFIVKWRAESENVLKLCEQIIVPSDCVKEIFSEYYTQLKDKIVVIEHGLSVMGPEFNLSDLQRSYKIKYNLEKIEYEHNLTVEGWAYLEDIRSDEIETFILLEDNHKNVRIFTCQNVEREDLSEIDNKYFKAGFRINNVIVDLTGEISVTVVIKHKNMYFAEKTTQKIQIGIHKKNNVNALRIAFLGGISPEKGAQEIYSLVKNFKQNNVQWYIFGPIGDRQLDLYEQNNLIKIGQYNRNNIVSILQQYEIDLVCILSIWPETFCYTLSEAVLAKIPVVVSDTGALGERVRRDALGWLVSIENMQDELFSLVQQLLDDNSILNQQKEKMNAVVSKSAMQMGEEYAILYSKYPKLKSMNSFDSTFIFEAWANANNRRQKSGESDVYADSLEKELEAIKASTTYKVSCLLQQIKFPGKAKLKRVAYYIYKKIK